MTTPSEHASFWSLRLLAILQEMAARQTNAALELLANVEQPETERPYPEGGLLFAARRWRAFYHCHESTALHPKEHGHFHLFTDIGNRDWAHVAGLSIDTEGQPLQWFTVNRWVTDGPWLQQQRLPVQLNHAAAAGEDDSLVGNWLLALLQLYRDTLSCLLIRRDKQLQQGLPGRSKADLLDDRAIYTLATESIDLQSMLEQPLLRHNACPGEETGTRGGPACTAM